MFERYYSVSFMVHDKIKDEWITDISWTGKDERTAWIQYGSEESRLLSIPEYDVVTVYILNDGGYMDSRTFDERELIIPPEPIEDDEI